MRIRFFAMLAAAAVLAVCGISRQAPAQATPFVGQIMLVPYNFCPTGWTQANGQIMQISQNTALFSLLGTFYGGNGVTTFALPALKTIYAVNGQMLVQCIALQGVFPSRN